MKITVCMMAIALGIALLSSKLLFRAGAIPTNPPELVENWDQQVVRLDEGEMLRFIPAGRGRGFGTTVSWDEGHITHSVYEVTDHGTCAVFFSESMLSVMCECGQINLLQLELQEDLKFPSCGNWSIALEGSTERRMGALQSVLRAVNAQNISIQNELVEREVIVARGTWNFHALDDAYAFRFYVPESGQEQSWADKIATGSIHDGTIAESFLDLQGIFEQPIISEFDQPLPRVVHWRRPTSIVRPAIEESLDQILSNLHKQTGVKFIRTRRKIPIWFIREDPSALRATNSR